MTDTTVPSPSPASLLPSPLPSPLEMENEVRTRSDSSSGEGEFDTSADLSPSTATKGAGESDAKTDNKQKRKRTSPADQAILEGEYNKNPKPNKAARAEIVKVVSLNEKEVQIWFQNRRQINRRKSRPLLPHEIAAFGLGGMAALSSDPAQLEEMISSQSSEAPGQGLRADGVSSQEQEPSSSEIQTLTQDTEPNVEPASSEEAKAAVLPALPPPTSLKRHSSSISIGEGSSFSGPDSAFKSFTSTPGYLANRWNSVSSSFSTPSASQNPVFATPSISQTTKQPASCPERLSTTPSSTVRLSMSLDGKAELVSGSPSPPHVYSPRPSSSSGPFHPQKRMRTLQRSQSALPLPSQMSSVAGSLPFVPRLGTGRSRDARTWEFCCDGDTRDELTAHAEQESNGSAVAAISLMRSASNSALKSNANKRNAPTGKQDPSKNGKRTKFGRVQSSLARLQHAGKETEQLSGYGKEGLMRSPTGDSDKENWLPGENGGNGGNSRRRPLPSSKADKPTISRTVLGDNNNVPTHAVNLGGRNRKRKPTDVGSHIFQDQENGEDGGEEVQKFMRGEVSPSKKGDLDCIQGLLSLSQGNWR